MTDRPYLDWIHALPCLATGQPDSPCSGRITAHHVRRFGSARDDRRALPLCVGHHLHDAGPDSIERGKARFEKRFGVDLEKHIAALNADYKEKVRTEAMTMAERIAEIDSMLDGMIAECRLAASRTTA